MVCAGGAEVGVKFGKMKHLLNLKFSKNSFSHSLNNAVAQEMDIRRTNEWVDERVHNNKFDR